MVDQVAHFLMSVAMLTWIMFEPDSADPYAVAGLLLGIFREDASHRPKEGWWWWWPIEYRGTHKGEVVYIGGWGRWVVA